MWPDLVARPSATSSVGMFDQRQHRQGRRVVRPRRLAATERQQRLTTSSSRRECAGSPLNWLRRPRVAPGAPAPASRLNRSTSVLEGLTAQRKIKPQ